MTLIDSLHRLERVGSEHSRATQKLHEAATDVAQFVIKQVPSGSDLPRGYSVVSVKSNVSSGKFLLLEGPVDPEWGEPGTYWIDGIGGYLHGDFKAWIPAQSRAGSLQFAKDIASGWLDEVSAWLEARTAAADEAATTLEEVSK